MCMPFASLQLSGNFGGRFELINLQVYLCASYVQLLMRQRETDNYTFAHADNYVCLNLPCIKENTSMYVMIIDESITLHQARFVLIRPVRPGPYMLLRQYVQRASTHCHLQGGKNKSTKLSFISCVTCLVKLTIDIYHLKILQTSYNSIFNINEISPMKHIVYRVNISSQRKKNIFSAHK